MSENSLSLKELVERLRLRSADLVSDLLALTNRQLDAEDKRETSLASKAASLLSASGVSVSFAIGFATLIGSRIDYFKQMGTCARSALIVVYAVAVLCAILAGLLAVGSMLVRTTYVAVNEDDVFGEVLSASDAQTEGGQAHYRRYLIAHLWQIYRHTFEVHEGKARIVRLGQIFYAMFLILLILIGLAMAYMLARS